MLCNIAVTGYELYTAAGMGVELNTKALEQGVGFTTSHDRIWTQLGDTSIETGAAISKLIRSVAFKGLKMAGFVEENVLTDEWYAQRKSLVFGSNFYETSIWEQDKKDSSLLWCGNMSMERLIKELDIDGGAINVSTACSSGACAITTACQLIESGQAELVVIVGYDLRTCIPEYGMQVIGAVSKDRIRPFDLNRTGTDLAEGIGFMVLERSDAAIRRNAPVYAWIRGYAMTNDAYNITAPNPDGICIQNALEQAIQNAGIKPDDIEYINTHGSGTKINDILETNIIKRVFGDCAASIYINSSKSIIGHTLGAAGLIEAIITVISIHRGFVHGTANFLEVDPKCDLNYCTEGCIYKNIRYAMSNSIGFGGINVSIVFEKGDIYEA